VPATSAAPAVADERRSTQRFSDRAQAYAAYRPSYPQEAIDAVLAGLGDPSGLTVADIGAGTGISSRLFADRGANVVAVEPNAAMRAAAQPHPRVQWRSGTADHTGLAGASVDVAVVCQAFHWFDAPRALAEIHRVLVPGGALGLIWNERDETVAWVEELSRAMRWDVRQPYEVGTDFSDVVAAGPFEDVARVEFKHVQTLTREGLYQRVLTTSYISLMSDKERDVLMRDVALVVERQAEPITLPYATSVYTAKAALLVG